MEFSKNRIAYENRNENFRRNVAQRSTMFKNLPKLSYMVKASSSKNIRQNKRCKVITVREKN